MIYTVGSTKFYDHWIKEIKPFEKAKDGSVWKTYDEAKKHAPEGFSVYGVEADWLNDVVEYPNEPWGTLIRDAKITKL